MNKIYISADVEGLNGITSFNQVLPEFNADYRQMQTQLHLEINSVIKGLQNAGIKEIVINDAHNTMTNLNLTELPNNITLISGKPKKVSMMYGLDKSFDGVILFAYHAKATSKGVLAHTFNMHFKSVSLNGEKISEAQLNAIYAQTLNIPILLASGDDVFCNEIKEDIGDITTIKTKDAISNTAAICTKNKELLSIYEKTAANIKNLNKIYYKTYPHYELKVEFENESLAKNIANAISLKQEKQFVCFTSADYIEIYTTLQKISAETTSQKSQNQQV